MPLSGTRASAPSSQGLVGPPHPFLPRVSSRDLVVRRTADGWLVEDASGRPICEILRSLAEARLVSRTFVPERGRVWVCDGRDWSVLDDD